MREVREGSLPRECLYAPAEPFAEAIREWLHAYDREMRALPFANITYTKPRQRNTLHRSDGLIELEKRTNVPRRSLRRYLSGESQLIEIDSADRLAMGLGIPLWTLAEEFLPHGKARQALDESRKAAA